MKNTRGLPPSEAQLSEPSKAPRSLCIVVADDDRDAVLTLTMVLRHEGHDVLAAPKAVGGGRSQTLRTFGRPRAGYLVHARRMFKDSRRSRRSAL